MKDTKPTPQQTAAFFSEADRVALEAFLSGLIEQAEKDAETCIALHNERTVAEWAELDAALELWLTNREKAGVKSDVKAA